MLNLPVLLTLRSDGCQVLSYIKEGYSEVAARTERLLDERTYELAHVLVQESPQDLDLAPDPLTVKRPSSSLLYADGHGSDHLHCVPLFMAWAMVLYEPLPRIVHRLSACPPRTRPRPW